MIQPGDANVERNTQQIQRTVVAHVPARLEWQALLANVPHLPAPQPFAMGEYTTLQLPAPNDQTTVVLLRGGVGKINAAASSQYAILTWKPTLYAVIGTAGAIATDLNELDLVIATRTIVHDLNPQLSPLASTLASDHTIDLPWHWDRCEFPFPVRRGVVVTGDADVTSTNVEGLRTRHNATIGDWESGAVAKVCAMNSTPCLVIRGVTDRPAGPIEAQFERFRTNTPLVMERVWQALMICLRHYY